MISVTKRPFQQNRLLYLEDDSLKNAHHPLRPLGLHIVLVIMILSSSACTGIPLLEPTATPIPTNTPTATATPTPTLTPTATLTDTATITPTVSYFDWPVVFSDSFNDNSNGWDTGKSSDEYASVDISITGGKYLFTVIDKKSVFAWYNSFLGNLGDCYVSVDVRKIAGTTAADYGLVFRAGADYYAFTINADTKQYDVYEYADYEWTPIIRFTRSEVIDPKGVNRLALLAQGSAFTLFINGEEIRTFEDKTLISGTAGVAFEMGRTGDLLKLEFDNFEIRAPQQA
jgi:hypothetical protein